MKKLLALYLIVFSLLAAFTLIGCETTSVEAEEPSSTAEWLDEWLPRIEAILISAVTVIITLIGFYKKGREQTERVKSAIGELNSTNEKYVVKAQDFNGAITELTKTRDELNRSIEQAQALRTEVDTLKEVLLVAFANNEELVRKGISNEIVRLLGNEEEN